jgi:hypothetical protein
MRLAAAVGLIVFVVGWGALCVFTWRRLRLSRFLDAKLRPGMLRLYGFGVGMWIVVPFVVLDSDGGFSTGAQLALNVVVYFPLAMWGAIAFNWMFYGITSFPRPPEPGG